MMHMSTEQLESKVLTQPCEVDGDLLAEVLADVVEGLILVPFAPRRPVVVEDLANVQLGGVDAIARVLERTLNNNSKDHEFSFWHDPS